MYLLSTLLCVTKRCHPISMIRRKASAHCTQNRQLSMIARSSILPDSVSSLALSASTPLTVNRERTPMIQANSVNFFLKNHFSKSHQQCDSHSNVPNEMSETQYEALAEETLNSLYDFFDVLPDVFSCSDEYDSEMGNGVLTVRFDSDVGTYVINKQTPNKQIWLSSPKTGPKRYDFCGDKWIYLRDGVGLHHLLEEEISEILGFDVSLKDCKHYS